jgi:hypothetical protein
LPVPPPADLPWLQPYRAFALDVLRVEDGKVAEITSFIQPGAGTGEFHVEFGWDMFAAFGLPPTL